VTLERPLPRFVEVRRLARGSAAFYFRIPTYYRKLGCEMANEPLGTRYEAACGDDGKGGRAAALHALFDEWNNQRRGEPIEGTGLAEYVVATVHPSSILRAPDDEPRRQGRLELAAGLAVVGELLLRERDT